MAMYRSQIDIFEKDTVPADYQSKHPFSKLPTLQHGEITLYESDAIAQYHPCTPHYCSYTCNTL